MDKLSDILTRATAAVGQSYFRVNIADGDSLFRERVYCYELYHQMRQIWPIRTSLVLNGEVDKQSNPKFSSLGKRRPKPDLLVHEQGSMASNHAIIEVKHSTHRRGVRKDLEVLRFFLQEASYKRAIYLIYGPKANEDGVAKVVEVGKEFEGLGGVEVWLHPIAGKSASLHTTLT